MRFLPSCQYCCITLVLFITACHHTNGDKGLVKYGKVLELADSLSHTKPATAESLYYCILNDSSSAAIEYQVKALTGASGILTGKMAYDTAAEMLRKAQGLAASTGDSNLMMKVLQARGDLFIFMGDNIKAGKCYQEGLEIGRRAHDPDVVNSFSLALGAVERDQGNFAEAVRIFTEAAKIAETSGIAINQALALENIGLTLNYTGDYREAMKYINQALEIRKTNNLLQEYAMGLQNLGISYKKLNLLDSALICYREAGKILISLHDSNTLVKVLYNTGLVYKNQKKYPEAQETIENVLRICRKKNIADGEVYALHTLAAILSEEGLLREGIAYSDSAIRLAKQRKLFSNLPNLLDRKQALLADNGNFREAYLTAVEYRELSDSLLPDTKQKEIALLKTRFETERKEAENELLKTDLEYQRTNMIFLWITLFLSLLLFLFILLMLNFRFKNLRQLKLLAEEKALKEEERMRNQSLELEKSKLEAELQEAKITDLEYHAKLKEQQLVFQSLIRTELTNVNRSVHERLFPFSIRFPKKRDQEEFRQELQGITREAQRDPLKEFELAFTQLHLSFFDKLLAKAPAITKAELQVCAMIRLNLSSKDIARLLNHSVSTIETTRHFVRQKLGLENSESLSSYLISL